MSSFAYYYTLQTIARERTQNAINKRLLKGSGQIRYWDNLTLCSILGTDIGDAIEFATKKWPEYYSKETHMGFSKSWEQIVYSNIQDPDHFNLAIWQKIDNDQVLVALAAGNPSHARTHLTVKWVERFFGSNYLGGRALWPILTCAEEYARLLGSERVLIKSPVDPAKYERYGYKAYRHPDVPHGGNYLARELNNG